MSSTFKGGGGRGHNRKDGLFNLAQVLRSRRSGTLILLCG